MNKIITKISYSVAILFGIFAFMVVPAVSFAVTTPEVNTLYPISINQTQTIIAGEVVSTGGENVDRWFEWGLNENLNEDPIWMSLPQSDPGRFTRTLWDIEMDTTYYYRACAENTVDYDCGETLSFIIDSFEEEEDTNEVPVVEALSVDDVTENSAWIRAKIVEVNDDYATRYFKWKKVSGGSYEYDYLDFITQENPGNFTLVIDGLESGTEYKYTACAVNSYGTGCDSVFTYFTTLVDDTPEITAPTVLTYSEQNVDENSATLRGHVSSTGGENVWNRKFYWGTNGNFNNNETLSGTAGTGVFELPIDNLTSSTTYNYYACAQNSADEDCGSVVNFTTTSNNNTNYHDPVIYTEEANGIGYYSATLQGEISDFGNGNVYRYFKWGESSNNLNHTESVGGSTNNVVSFSQQINNLDDDTTYYFQACGELIEGSSYDDCGSIFDFKTYNDSNNNNNDNDEDPDVETKSAQDVEDDSAELRGEVDMNDFNNGIVFFVYGQNENDIDDVEHDYDRYSQVDEDGQDLQKVKVDNDLDGDDSFDEVVNNLDEDEKYYFRICVEYDDEDNDETLECGNTRNFSTDDNGGNNNNNYDGDLDATTTNASGITRSGAIINGYVQFDSGENAFYWFEHGSNAFNLTKTTSVGSAGNNGFAFVNKTVSNISENSSYFFRLCAKYQNGDEDCGDVKSFVTNKKTTTNTVIIKETVTTNTNNNNTVEIIGDVSGGGSMFLALDIDPDFENVIEGDTVNFDVDYKNISDGTIRDVVVRVIFPEQMRFERSTKGFYLAKDHAVTYNIGSLEEGESGEIFVQAKVLNSSDQDLLVTTAEGVHTHPNVDNAQASVIAYALNTISENENVLGAFAAGSGFGIGIIGFLIILFIILLIIWISRRMYTDHKDRRAQQSQARAQAQARYRAQDSNKTNPNDYDYGYTPQNGGDDELKIS